MMPAWTQPRLTSISWQISPCRVLAACPRTGLSLVGAGHVSRSRAVIGGEPAGPAAACVGGGCCRPGQSRRWREAQRAVSSGGGQTVSQSVSERYYSGDTVDKECSGDTGIVVKGHLPPLVSVLKGSIRGAPDRSITCREANYHLCQRETA